MCFNTETLPVEIVLYWFWGFYLLTYIFTPSCISGGGLDQTAQSHHRPRCEGHGAGEAARGNPQQHQETLSPGQRHLRLHLIVLACRRGADSLCLCRW